MTQKWKYYILALQKAKNKSTKRNKKRRRKQPMKNAQTLGALYIDIDNFIKTRLYIKGLKINLMYKLYMVGFLCPPKVQMD